MYLAIDGRRLIRAPHNIEIVPYEHTTGFTADARPTVKPAPPHVTINCTWGRELSYQDVMGELERLRARRGVHSLTFEPIRGCEYLTINGYMGVPRQAHIGYDSKGKIVTSSFTVPFVQVDTTTFLYPLRFRFPGILSVLSPYTYIDAPAAGTIISVQGCIRDLGAGAGQTRVQLRNNDSAIDYLATPGDFPNTAPPSLVMANQVLGTVLDFAEGDRLYGNITAIPAGGMSRDALVTAWAWLHRP